MMTLACQRCKHRGRRDSPHAVRRIPSPTEPIVTIAFCSDDDLAYDRSRTRFAPGCGLPLDDAYRLAHLPLVAPGHPGVIATRAGTPYERGRHPTAHSVVLPLPADALDASPAYRALDAELRAAPFAAKVAWPMLDRRRGRLHATLCGGLGPTVPAIAPEALEALARLGSVTVEVRGPFSGTVNHGRLYLRVYPERRGGENLFHAVQRALGRPVTDLYVAGLWNFVDGLDPSEAEALAGCIARWWRRVLLRVAVRELWVLGSRDDLVLDAEIAARLSLAR